MLYNHLNMPTKITVTGTNAGVLEYTYSADGIKLQKKKTQGGIITTTAYADNFVYENNTLKQFYQPEGYVEPKGSSSEIRREQSYYPFGLEHKGYNNIVTGTENNHKTY